MKKALSLILLLAGMILLLDNRAVQSASQAGSTTRVSIKTGGAQGNGDSLAADVSADGRYVVFESRASNLVDGDTNGAGDIFVHDRVTGVTERASVSSSGEQGNFGSFAPAISDDGRIIVFASWSTNLVSGDSNNVADVFAHDRVTHKTELVSMVLGGSANDVSTNPDVSGDGRYVTFWSYASNLVGGDSNNAADVFRFDRQDKVMIRASVGATGNQSNGESSHPAISADGQRIAFESAASNLVSGDGNNYKDIFLRDITSGAGGGNTHRVSVSSSGLEANGDSFSPAISGDGLTVAFSSFAANLVPSDNNGYPDVFIRQWQAGVTERVSVSSNGAEANNWCEAATLSADGRYVSFQSQASTLAAGDGNNVKDIFVRDRTAGTTTLISTDSNGAPGSNESQAPAMAGQGRFVVFHSSATNLIPGDSNSAVDVFIHDRTGPPTLTVNFADGAPGSEFAFSGSLYTPNTLAIISVNTVSLTAVSADSNGNLAFRLSTTSGNQEGGYIITVVQGYETMVARITLTAAAPVRPPTGSGPVFPIPTSVTAFTEHLYLPLAFKN